MTTTCALHPDGAAVGVCERCGRFACGVCLRDGLCTACAQRVLDPYGMHRHLDHLAAVRIAFQLIGAELPKLGLLALLFSVLAAAAQMLVSEVDDLATFSTSYRVSSVFEVFVGTIGTQAMLAILIARAEGRALSVGAALREGVANWPRFIGSRLRSGVLIVLCTLLLLVPGIWQAVLLLFSGTAALRVRDLDALEASRRLVRGRFWSVFFVAALCLGALVFAMGFAVVLDVMLDETAAPRFVAELIPELLTRVATDVVSGALLLVSFVMLHVDAELPLEPMRWRGAPPPRQS